MRAVKSIKQMLPVNRYRQFEAAASQTLGAEVFRKEWVPLRQHGKVALKQHDKVDAVCIDGEDHLHFHWLPQLACKMI